jgi:tetratricopeptide (TPR) repeat protein
MMKDDGNRKPGSPSRRPILDSAVPLASFSWPARFLMRAVRDSSFTIHHSAFILVLCLAWSATPVHAAAFEDLFRQGVASYHAGDYAGAAKAFQQSAAKRLASGTFQNLGNAEWKLGHIGAAILAWERASWLNAFNEAARTDLRFARRAVQLEAPELAWYEVISTWLPANWWAWMAGASLWTAVGLVMLPGILRLRKATWHQAVAAFCLMVFLLSVPAYIGLHTRSRIGFVLQADTPLRLTPTLEAQAVTRLPAGEPARLVRTRGNYLLIRTNRALGWVERSQFTLVCTLSQGPSPGSTQKAA